MYIVRQDAKIATDIIAEAFLTSFYTITINNINYFLLMLGSNFSKRSVVEILTEYFGVVAIEFYLIRHDSFSLFY